MTPSNNTLVLEEAATHKPCAAHLAGTRSCSETRHRCQIANVEVSLVGLRLKCPLQRDEGHWCHRG